MKWYVWAGIAVACFALGFYLGGEWTAALLLASAGTAAHGARKRVTDKPDPYDDTGLAEAIADDTKDDPAPTDSANPFDSIIGEGRAVSERDK